MGASLDRHVQTLLDAIAFAWPATAFGLDLHAPQPIPPVDDDDDDDDEDDNRGGGSGGGNIDPDDDDGSDEDDDDDDEETLWTRREGSDRAKLK